MKIIITLLVTITAIGAHFQQAAAGQSTNQWVVLFLGAFMIFALWLFPETKKGRR
jgi:hypothetical protein